MHKPFYISHAKFLMAFMTVFVFLSSPSFAGEAQITHIENAVLIHRHSGGATEVAKTGALLTSEDQVETLNGAKAHVQIGERGFVELEQKTKWQFGSFEEKAGTAVAIDSNLLLGKLKAKFKNMKDDSKFEIITPTSVASVRGTGFQLHVYPMAGDFYTRIEVSDGVVAFSGLDRLNPSLVEAGESLVYVKGSMRKPTDDMSDVPEVIQKEWFGDADDEFRDFENELDESAPIISETRMS